MVDLASEYSDPQVFLSPELIPEWFEIVNWEVLSSTGTDFAMTTDDGCGPVRAWRDNPVASRHVPGCSPWGGYEMAWCAPPARTPNLHCWISCRLRSGDEQTHRNTPRCHAMRQRHQPVLSQCDAITRYRSARSGIRPWYPGGHRRAQPAPLEQCTNPLADTGNALGGQGLRERP